MTFQRGHRLLPMVCSAALAVTALGGYGVAHATGGQYGPAGPIAGGLSSPLQFEVVAKGAILVGGGNGVDRVAPGGTVTNIVSDQGVDGVAAGPWGSVYYTSTGTGFAKIRKGAAGVAPKDVADTLAYEQANNPDQGNRYGLQGLTPECAAQLPPEFVDQPGGVDSHPYALAQTRRGLLVADAGGNDILRVGRWGIETVAVLPPQPLVVTAEAAAGSGLPDCVVGKTFNFEPVPTDVEVGHDGSLYVATLPGGPEDPSLGARGSVYRISCHGRVKQIATGFAGATNLALAPWRGIYVAELFGNRVSRVGKNGPVAVADVNQPAGLEWSRGRLYVSSDVFIPDAGKISTLAP